MSALLAALPVIGQLLDKVIPDPAARDKAKLEAMQLAQAGEFRQIEADLQVMLAQADVNKAEAATDAFRGGWRPAVGWVCVSGMAYTYLAQPILAWISSANGLDGPPTIETFDLLIMLGGMLGFGGMRSFERIKGRA